ncbi:broad-complex core protein isoforms 1/2/3/4/5-like [Hetaerina americana]|uniref:broad-complex core protein isoforms 1/2/3/4/5-like n=1 Tax=Hetaerina americana TaxID=62018 RepID=UPI003A7F2E3F
MAGQQICLKWNSFQTNIVTSFENLWEEEGLVDVTLASDGQCIRAHKVILSACSPFFRQVFQSNPCQHPVIILQDVHFSELESLLCFVYKGEVNIGQENLPALLKAAETLQIRGLSGASEQVKEKMAIPRKASCPEGPETPLLHPPAKRHRGCSTTPPHTTTTTNTTPPQQQHQHPPLDETPPCPATTPPLALTAKTMTAEGVSQGEGPQTQMAPCCGELMAAQSTVEMLEEEGGLLAQDEAIGEG